MPGAREIRIGHAPLNGRDYISLARMVGHVPQGVFQLAGFHHWIQVDPGEYLGIPVPQFLGQFSGVVGATPAKIHDQGSQYFLAAARQVLAIANRIREVVRIGGAGEDRLGGGDDPEPPGGGGNKRFSAGTGV